MATKSWDKVMGFDTGKFLYGSAAWLEGKRCTARQTYHRCHECNTSMPKDTNIFWHRTHRDSRLASGWKHGWFCGRCHNRKFLKSLFDRIAFNVRRISAVGGT